MEKVGNWRCWALGPWVVPGSLGGAGRGEPMAQAWRGLVYKQRVRSASSTEGRENVGPRLWTCRMLGEVLTLYWWGPRGCTALGRAWSRPGRVPDPTEEAEGGSHLGLRQAGQEGGAAGGKEGPRGKGGVERGREVAGGAGPTAIHRSLLGPPHTLGRPAKAWRRDEQRRASNQAPYVTAKLRTEKQNKHLFNPDWKNRREGNTATP